VTKPAPVEFIEPPDLRHKVSEASADPEAMARAEAALAKLSNQYLDWVQHDLASLQAAYREAAAAAADGRPERLKALFKVAHDMKGQGATFGYPLVTRIGYSLCRYLERDGDSPSMTVVGAHVDALRAVIVSRAAGEDATGTQLAAGLEAMVAKLG
jgi:chemotaxis protein histidine kinase CheA